MPTPRSPLEAPPVRRSLAVGCSLAVAFAVALWGCADNSPALLTVNHHAATLAIPAATASPTPPGGCSGSAGTGSGLSGCIDTTATPGPSPTPTPLPTPTPAPLTVAPQSLTLYLPPPAGATALFAPAAASLVASGAVGAIGWQSSDPAVAQVDGTGRVTAGQAGTALLTATDGTQRATASVTVQSEAELQVAAPGTLPAGATGMTMTVTDASGSVLFSGGATADLTDLGNLTVDAHAVSAAGVPLAAGRWQGLTLVAGELQTASIPLNVPSLQAVQPGGPGAWVMVAGGGFQAWHQGPGTGTYMPTIAATVDGDPAPISVLSDSLAEIQLPASLSGMPATRSLQVTVGGVPLSTAAALLGTLRISAPPATLSISASNGLMGNQYQYAATTLDTAGSLVNGAALSWGLLGGDLSAPTVGTMAAGGLFTPTQTGTATVTVRSGQLVATASLQVVP